MYKIIQKRRLAQTDRDVNKDYKVQFQHYHEIQDQKQLVNAYALTQRINQANQVKQDIIAEKRQKAMSSLHRWEDFRESKAQVIGNYVKARE